MPDNHNRTTGIYDENITLYAFFYKQRLNETVLVDPQSIGYVQFYRLDFTTEQDIVEIGEDPNNPGNPIIPQLEEELVEGGVTAWVYPSENIVRVSKGMLSSKKTKCIVKSLIN